MRPDTKLEDWKLHFIFNDGGMGDLVNYAGATVWLAKNCPWVHGRIFVPRYLANLMADVHEGFKNWIVWPSEDVKEHLEKGAAMLGPSIRINGVITSRQLLTVMGAHPIDVGFSFFAGSCPAPKDCVLPVLDYAWGKVRPDVRALKNYAVITTGATTPARTLTGKHLNPIIEFVKSKNLVPVFLGKSDLLNDGKKSTNFADDIRYDLGVDLRDKTSVKEAAAIMQHAAFTLGLDNGLLHLAALMKDSRIIFGYNITSVEHREPRRAHGKTINMYVTKDELPCSGCQSQLKHVKTHTFDKCLYGDLKCLDLLFKNEGEAWKKAITEMIG
jgi:hypothetical protein